MPYEEFENILSGADAASGGKKAEEGGGSNLKGAEWGWPKEKEAESKEKEVGYRKLPEGLVSEEEKLLLVHKLISKDTDAEKVPEGFEITPEMAGIEKAAENFIAQQKYFEEDCKKLWESKTLGEKNEAKIIRDNREKILKNSLDRVKMSVADKFAADKAKMLLESGEFSEKEIKKIINEEYLEYGARVILHLALPLEERIAQIKAESELLPREQGILRHMMEGYAKLPQWKRLAISCGISAGIGAGIVFAGTGGAIAAAAAYGITRAGRTFTGGALSAGLRYVSDKIIGKKYGKEREEALTEKEQDTLKKLNEQTAKWEKESEDWMENEQKKLKLMRVIDESAIETNNALRAVFDKEKKARRRATIASGIIGGMTVLAASMDWGALIGGKSPGVGTVVESGASSKPTIGTGVPVEQYVPPKIIGPTPDQLQQATVGEGEGIEHVLRRQFEADPTKWGFKGSVNDAPAIREWSGIRAHQIAIEEGYVNPKTGFETRVFDIGLVGPKGNPAYFLELDSSGKPNVVEFLDGKPTGGEDVMNAYEYPEPGMKPKMTDVLEQKKGIVPAVEEITARPVARIPVEPDYIADAPATGKVVPEVGRATAAVVEAPTVGLAKEEIISNLQDIQPAFKEAAKNFDEFSLLKQEQILSTQEVYDLGQHMRGLNGMSNITDADAEIMGEMNKYWSQMANAYSENLNAFNEAVHEATGLANKKSAEVFLNTKIGSIWDAYRGDDQALDFVKSVNPASDEITSNFTIGKILKSRFLDGEFVKTKITGAPGWVE